MGTVIVALAIAVRLELEQPRQLAHMALPAAKWG